MFGTFECTTWQLRDHGERHVTLPELDKSASSDAHEKEVGMTDVAERSDSAATPNRLNAGVLGLFDSVIMGIAGSAPAYSIGATTGALFFAVALRRRSRVAVLRILHVRHRVGLQLSEPR